jgi:tryptophan-rich sensory protein
MKSLPKAFTAIGGTLTTGFLGSLATTPNIPTWYATLNKPLWNPPNWLFAPVWTILYIMMGVSLFLIWKRPDSGRSQRAFYVIYLTQLVLNVLWSFLFFGLKNPPAALVEIVILWLTILFTIRAALATDKRAAYLLAPYLAWVTFATCLNLAIVMLN